MSCPASDAEDTEKSHEERHRVDGARRRARDSIATVAACEPAERVREVVDAHGMERTRIERGRARMLVTVFGKVAVTRIAYRGTAVEDLHPADVALNFPDGLQGLRIQWGWGGDERARRPRCVR
jgi:hypothetical protein